MRVSFRGKELVPSQPYRGPVGPSISLELTVDDVFACTVYALKAAAANRKHSRRRQLLVGLPLLALLPILVITAVRQPSPPHIVFLVVGVAFAAWFPFMPAVMVFRLPRFVGRLIGKGQISAPAPSLLWLDEHAGIVHQSVDGTVWYPFTAIERIDETPDYVFIGVGPRQALVIPRRIGEPAVQAFLQALHWYRGQTYADRAGQPPYGPNAWSA